MKLLSVVVPCYNEEEALPLFYEELMKTSETFRSRFPDVTMEIWFIDDGSSDQTLQVIRDLRKKDERIHYV